LRSPYPAGDGSAAIFRSMPANNRRVRSFAAYLVGAAYNLLRIAKLCPGG
jgi:hypothetical protein